MYFWKLNLVQQAGILLLLYSVISSCLPKIQNGIPGIIFVENPPAIPSGVSATPGDTQVTVQWTAVSNATSYNIYWKNTSGVTTANGTKIAAVKSPYTHTSLTNGKVYYYIVTAVNEIGESGASAEVSAIPNIQPTGAPTNVAASPGNATVQITWTNVTGATSYNIYWRNTTGVTSLNGTKITGVTSPHTHNSLTNGTPYYYIVTAVGPAGESVASLQAGATPIAPPAAPTGVGATPGDKQVTVSWTASTGATSYNIYYATTTGVTKGNGILVAGVTSPYVHSLLANGTTYYYVVTAKNAGGESPESLQVSATPQVPAPGTPTGVTAVTSNYRQNTVSWSAVTGAVSYNIYYGTAAGVTTGAGTKITGATSPYVHNGLTSGQTYYYIVTAVNPGGESSASAEVNATPTSVNWGAGLTSYTCRMPITISTASSVATGDYVKFNFDHAALVAAAKSRADGNDVRVAYYSGGVMTEISRVLYDGSSWNNSATRLIVQAQAPVAASGSDSNYYLYYCNPGAGVPAALTLFNPTPMAAQDSPFSDNTGSWINHPLTSSFTPAAATEVWLWFVTFAISYSDPNVVAQTLAQVTVNGAPIVNADVGPEYSPAATYKLVVFAGQITGTTALQTIGLQIKSGILGQTTTVKNVKITALRLPATAAVADYQYVADNPTQTLDTNGTGFMTIGTATHTFTPSSAGDYYIIATGQFKEGTSSDPEIRLKVDNGTPAYWPTQDNILSYYNRVGRNSYDTFFVMRKVALNAVSTTIAFEGWTPQASAKKMDCQNLQIFIFRASIFNSAESVENLAESGTTSVTAQTKSTLTTASPAGLSNYIAFQSQYLYDNAGINVHSNYADYQLAGTTVASQDHALDIGPHYQFASPTIHSFRTDVSKNLLNRYWSDAIYSTYSKESVIHVLGIQTVKANSSALSTEQTFQ